MSRFQNVKIKVRQIDLLDIGKMKPGDIIGHQVNCQGIMGSGVAAQIRKRFPIVFNDYRSLCSVNNYNPARLLGRVQFFTFASPENVEYKVCNIFGQDTFNSAYREGRLGEVTSDNRYTDYTQLSKAFNLIAAEMRNYFSSILYLPYKIGCGRGGGDWKIVLDMIKESFYDMSDRVILCAIDSSIPEGEI